MCWLNPVFPFILFLWIRIRNTDPDPRTQMNADPTGSGSTSLNKSIHISYAHKGDFIGATARPTPGNFLIENCEIFDV